MKYDSVKTLIEFLKGKKMLELIYILCGILIGLFMAIFAYFSSISYEMFIPISLVIVGSLLSLLMIKVYRSF